MHVPHTPPTPSDPPERSSPTLWAAAWCVLPPIAHARRGGGIVLDLGCGLGLGTLALADSLPSTIVTGHDRDPGLIARARALAVAAGLDHRVRFAVGDGLRLPRAAFDLIAVSLPRLVPAAPARALNEIRNALVPDGACLLQPLVAQDIGVLALAAGFSRTRPLAGQGASSLFELRR